MRAKVWLPLLDGNEMFSLPFNRLSSDVEIEQEMRGEMILMILNKCFSTAHARRKPEGGRKWRSHFSYFYLAFIRMTCFYIHCLSWWKKMIEKWSFTHFFSRCFLSTLANYYERKLRRSQCSRQRSSLKRLHSFSTKLMPQLGYQKNIRSLQL